MSSKRPNLRRSVCCYRPALILTWLFALPGCGDTTVDATSSMDGGAGNPPNDGAPNGGAANGTGGARTGAGGSVASGGAGAGGNVGGETGGAGTGGTAAATDGGSGTGGAGGPATDAAADTTPPPGCPTYTCTSPSHTIPMNPSNPQDGITLGGYYVDTDTWNAASYQVSQTMYICDYNNWYVIANMNNSSGDGAVKTYPNVHKDFNGAPQISSYTDITSCFAHTAPHVGIYEYAYDIWLNGVASSGSTEVMIWTDNYFQVPSGSSLETVTFDGQSYDVHRTSGGGYIAFVAKKNVTSGTVNLLSFFNHIISKGWIPADSTIGAIDYGVEIVSTDGTDARFEVNDFSLTAN